MTAHRSDRTLPPESSQAGEPRALIDWVGRGLRTVIPSPLPQAPDTSIAVRDVGPGSPATDRAADFIRRHPAWSLTYMSVVLLKCVEAQSSGASPRPEYQGAPNAHVEGGWVQQTTVGDPPERPHDDGEVTQASRYATSSTARRTLRGDLSAMVASLRHQHGTQAEVVVCRAALAAAASILASAPPAWREHSHRLAFDSVRPADASLARRGARIVQLDGGGRVRDRGVL